MSVVSASPVAITPALAAGDGAPLLFILGPCAIESEQHTLDLARHIARIAARLGAQVVFKASFDKANRTAIGSYRGPGPEAGMKILERVKGETGLAVTSDIHEAAQAAAAGEVLDLLQIPALLCRQTDLLVAAGRSGKPVNIKKGQFMAPDDMRFALEKVRSTGNDRVLLTERGTTFGYHNLVVDMRGLDVMRRLGHPVILDATHSVQLPSGGDGCSAGEARFIPVIARAGAGAGIDGFFFEVHDEPRAALCDGANALHLDEVEPLMTLLTSIDALVRRRAPA